MAGSEPILLATETSPSAARVTAAATKLASATGWPLVILAAWSLPVGTTAFESLHDTVAREDDARAAAVDACGRAAALASKAGVEARTLVVEGDAPAAICAVAEREHAAVIVIGTHSGRLAPRGSLGGVVDEVVGRAPCLLLLVPAR